MSEVPRSLEQPVSDPRGASRARSYLQSARGVYLDAEYIGAPRNYLSKLLGGVKLKAEHNAETVAQRGAELTCPRRSADKREAVQVKPYRACGGSFADDDIEHIILHRGVKHLLNGPRKAVDLVNEEHVTVVEVSQQCGEVARLLYRGAARHSEVDAHFVGDNAREGGLAETRRAVEQHMVERLSPLAGCFYINRKVFFNLILPDILAEHLRAQ